MDAAKEAISKLTSGHGHHTTEVTEHYNPAVTHEQVSRTKEHQDTTVIDKETHQDHYHTTVLPVKDQEVLPTEHSHNIAAVQHSEHRHGDHTGIKDKAAAELASFKDKREVAPVETSHSVAPTVAGEHHHHHVHETIQPVIQKQTIQPSVVHTTIPIHEVHHSEPKHYTASALPAVSLDQFQKQGGSLTGIADRTERFEGEPDTIAQKGLHAGNNTQHGSTTSSGLTGSSRSGVADTTSSGLHGTGTSGTASSGLTGSSHTGVADTTSRHPNTTSGSGLSSTGATSGTTGTGISNETSRAQQAIDPRVDRESHLGAGTTSSTSSHTPVGTTNTHHADSSVSGTSGSSHSSGKPSMLQKLNPFKDSDGDGKKGFMS